MTAITEGRDDVLNEVFWAGWNRRNEVDIRRKGGPYPADVDAAQQWLDERFPPISPKTEWALAIENEVQYAIQKHGADPWGRHELHGVLEEEYDELKRAIYADEPTHRVLKEAIEVCAVIVRYILTGDRYRGPHPTIPLRGRITMVAP